MELDRTKCFKQGGYDLANSKVIVQFSDLSVYEYQGLTLNQWLEWKESYPRGSYFNHHYRYSGIQFRRLNAWRTVFFLPSLNLEKSFIATSLSCSIQRNDQLHG